MKRKFLNFRNYFLVFITGVILSSCSKDKTATDDLIGTWTMGTATFNVMVGDKTLTQYFVDVMGLTPAEAQQAIILFNQQMQQSFTGTIQMKSDHTYSSTLGGSTDTGTWSLSSDRKKLTISSSSEGPMILDVIELTSSKLRLQGTESDSVDLNGDSIPETLNVAIDLAFTK
jgi:hypothetical protein